MVVNDMNYSELVNQTVVNNSESLVGRYYFDSVKAGLYRVVESEHIFTEFNWYCGARFADKRHLIKSAVKATKKEYERFMNCPKTQYQKRKV